MKRHWILIAIGAGLGATAGWLYWSYIGCASGTCAITSDPLNSALYGTFVGGLFGSTVDGWMTRKTPNEQPL